MRALGITASFYWFKPLKLNVLVTIRFALFLLVLIPSASAIAEQFSVECHWTEPYFVTFDTETRRAVYEAPSGSALKGRINSETEGEIEFDLLQPGVPKNNLIWDRRAGKLTWIGLPNDAQRPTKVFDCRKTALRRILSIYKNIAPME